MHNGRALGQVCGPTTIAQDHKEPEVPHGIAADPWTTMSAWDAIGRQRDYDTIMHGRIMTYMAGAEAEEVLLGDRAGGDTHDRRQVALMLSTLLGYADDEETAAWEQRLRHHTRVWFVVTPAGSNWLPRRCSCGTAWKARKSMGCLRSAALRPA